MSKYVRREPLCGGLTYTGGMPDIALLVSKLEEPPTTNSVAKAAIIGDENDTKLQPHVKPVTHYPLNRMPCIAARVQPVKATHLLPPLQRPPKASKPHNVFHKDLRQFTLNETICVLDLPLRHRDALVAFLEMGSSKYAPPRHLVLHNASCLIARRFLFAAGAALAVSLGLALLPVINPDKKFDNFITWNKPTFYDDPNVSYSIGKPMEDWDEKRKKWLLHHLSFAAGVGDRVLLVTGSQATACSNPVGDHLLLRCFEKKVDYCRLHGYDIFYNNLALHPKVTGAWAKIPILRAAMLAHPEVEWMWWVDSDMIVADMDFKIPLERYRDHNLVVYGWWHEIYDKHSWTSVNKSVLDTQLPVVHEPHRGMGHHGATDPIL
ncbi:unnamed protein product [Malus baccata var. baccata]